MIIKQCTYCNQKFHLKNRKMRFHCGFALRIISGIEDLDPVVNCLNCGDPVVTFEERFCSIECADLFDKVFSKIPYYSEMIKGK